MKSERYLICKRRLFAKEWLLFLPIFSLFPAMISCSGGGIGGSGVSISTSAGEQYGITSIGPVTQMSSIMMVNGIEFKTTGATVTLDGLTSDVKDIQVGMVVKVEGSVDADGKTGSANAIVFEPNALGPIDSIDLAKNTLKVMGQTILIDEQTTFAGLPGSTTGLAGLAANDLAEISGLTDAGGNIKATRITRKTDIIRPEVSGRVSSLPSNAFNINTLTVDYSNAIFDRFGPLGIQPGDFVEIKGNLTSLTILQADIIEKKSPDFKDGNIEIEGFIDSLFYAGQSISGFAIITPFGLQRVELTNSTEFSGGQLDKLKAGARVEVEGTILNNIMQAKKIAFLSSII
ncbi:MAG TPA: DUF5666 domain-containing protein [Syntrophales bacterium]|nr:DUF5666 domain-containing protein [Syntrophales bacterium]